MATQYRTSATGADIDKLPNLIKKSAELDAEITATNEKIQQHEERIDAIEQSGGGSGGSGSVVVVNPILTSGTKVAEITINGSKKSIFAPTSNGGSAEGYKWIQLGYLREPVRKFMAWCHNFVWDDDLGCAVGIVISGTASHSNKAPYHRVFVYPNGYMSEYEEVAVNYPNAENNDCGYIDGMIRNDDGTYMMIDYYHRVFRSADKCLTWDYVGSANVDNDSLFGLTKLSNGTFLGGNGLGKESKVYRSTDGINWTAVSIATNLLTPSQVYPDTGWTPFEPFFIEGDNGKVIMYARASTNAFLTGSTDAHMRKEPAVYSVSNDYGQTWSAWKWSESIVDMTNNNGKYAEVDGACHLVFGSRFENNLKMYYSHATVEDALADRWSDPVLIDEGHWGDNASFHCDGGYPSVWVDHQKNVYAIYYDSDGSGSPDGASYRLLTSNPYAQHRAVSNEGKGSLNVAYTQKAVDLLISKLQNQINDIILEIGGEVEDVLDGSHPVSSGMLAWYEVNADSKNPITPKVGSIEQYAITRKDNASYSGKTEPSDFANGLSKMAFALDDLASIGVGENFSVEFTGKFIYVWLIDGRYSYTGANAAKKALNHYKGGTNYTSYINHVVINFSNSGYTMYFDGEEAQTGTDTIASMGVNSISIGGNNAWLNNIMVYDHCLSSEEMQNNLAYARSVVDFSVAMS